MGSMEAGAQQRWRGRGGCGDDPGNRTTRARRVSGGASGGAAGRPISSFPGEAAVHTESRWEAAAIGDTDGTGSSGADGGEACDGADFRGGLPAEQLWIPTEEERATGPGSDTSSRQPGTQFRSRCGHSRLLRQHPEGNPDGVGEGADLGSKGTEVNPAMVGSGSDGGRHGEGNAGGNPAGWWRCAARHRQRGKRFGGSGW